jgi:hypothetical protein
VNVFTLPWEDRAVTEAGTLVNEITGAISSFTVTGTFTVVDDVLAALSAIVIVS